MAGEALDPARPNRLTFAVPAADALTRFVARQPCDAQHRHGDPMRGIVAGVKVGTAIALVAVDVP